MKDNYMTDYLTKIHKFGRKSTIMFLIALIAVPVSMSIVWNIPVDIKTIAIALSMPLALFLVVGTVEVFSIAPIIGPGGTYMSFCSGNTLNVKLPAAVSSVKLTGYETGSKEAEVVSIIAIAVSCITSMVLMLIGMLTFSMILPILQSPVLTPAFENFMPAVLAALIFPMFRKDFKGSIVPIILVGLLTIMLGHDMITDNKPFFMPFIIALAVLWKYFLYKRSNKSNTAEESK